MSNKVTVEASDLGQIIDLINGHIEDFATDIAKSFERHDGALEIAFKVKLAEVNANLGVDVGIEFDQEPKPKKPEPLLPKAKNKIHIIIEKNQKQLF